MEEMVDITPTQLGGTGQTGIIFQESEMHQINENPSRLTREGILERIEQWKMSNNKHVIIKYKTMLARCKNIAPSGNTLDKNGKTRVILSRDKNGNPLWTKELIETITAAKTSQIGKVK